MERSVCDVTAIAHRRRRRRRRWATVSVVSRGQRAPALTRVCVCVCACVRVYRRIGFNVRREQCRAAAGLRYPRDARARMREWTLSIYDHPRRARKAGERAGAGKGPEGTSGDAYRPTRARFVSHGERERSQRRPGWLRPSPTRDRLVIDFVDDGDASTHRRMLRRSPAVRSTARPGEMTAEHVAAMNTTEPVLPVMYASVTTVQFWDCNGISFLGCFARRVGHTESTKSSTFRRAMSWTRPMADEDGDH